jgi:hypothetical protein
LQRGGGRRGSLASAAAASLASAVALASAAAAAAALASAAVLAFSCCFGVIGLRMVPDVRCESQPHQGALCCFLRTRLLLFFNRKTEKPSDAAFSRLGVSSSSASASAAAARRRCRPLGWCRRRWRCRLVEAGRREQGGLGQPFSLTATASRASRQTLVPLDPRFLLWLRSSLPVVGGSCQMPCLRAPNAARLCFLSFVLRVVLQLQLAC